MINLLIDSVKAEIMGAEAQKIVEKLSPGIIYGQWENYVQMFLK